MEELGDDKAWETLNIQIGEETVHEGNGAKRTRVKKTKNRTSRISIKTIFTLIIQVNNRNDNSNDVTIIAINNRQAARLTKNVTILTDVGTQENTSLPQHPPQRWTLTHIGQKTLLALLPRGMGTAFMDGLQLAGSDIWLATISTTP